MLAISGQSWTEFAVTFLLDQEQYTFNDKMAGVLDQEQYTFNDKMAGALDQEQYIFNYMMAGVLDQEQYTFNDKLSGVLDQEQSHEQAEEGRVHEVHEVGIIQTEKKIFLNDLN